MVSLTYCLPIEVRAKGGMYTFMGYFLAHLQQEGIQFTQSLSDTYDILFVNSWVIPYKLILKIKRDHPNIRVIQRVDGSAQDYGRHDNADNQQAKVNLLADLTIFQSQYSKHSSREKFRVIHQNGPVVYNPVDPVLFNPEGDKMSLPGSFRICNASWSTNRKKGTWKLGQLAQQHPDITFVLCGRYEDIPDVPNICMLGHLDRNGMAAAMRSCHSFLNLSENDPCPNVILEAMASGLPIMYVDSGGVNELVGNSGFAIRCETFRQSYEKMISCHTNIAQEARKRILEHFTPEIIFPQYLAAIAATQRRTIPTLLERMQLRVKGYPVLKDRTLL